MEIPDPARPAETAQLPRVRIPKKPPHERYNPLIRPSDEQWKLIERDFDTLLENLRVTIGQVLKEYFTEHEGKLFLPTVEPVSLVNLQTEHKKRYRALLAGRFKDHRLTLGTKFTMLYFGLPVEPAISGLLDPARYLVDAPDDEGLREIQAQPPLHFLTAHDQRNFGFDSRRGKVAPFSTLPVPQSSLRPENSVNQGLRLRGGGSDDPILVPSESSDNGDNDNDDDGNRERNDTQVEGGGGDAGDDDVEMIDPGSAELPTSPGDRPQKRPVVNTATLKGYQGRITIDLRQRAEAEAAIRALLSVRPQEASEVVLVKFEEESNHVTRKHLYPQWESAYAEVLEYITEHNEAQGVGWFIHRDREETPPEFEPNTADVRTDVQQLSFYQNEQHRVAYFRMPSLSSCTENGPFKKFGFNDYMPFVQTAQSVLFGRTKMGEPGPNGLVGLNDDAGKTLISERMNLPMKGPWYGGLEIDADFLAYVHPTQLPAFGPHVELEKFDSDEIMFYVPGSVAAQNRRFSLRAPYAEASNILRKLRDLVFKEEKRIREFRIWHGVDFFQTPQTFETEKRYFTWKSTQDAEESEARDAASALSEFISTRMRVGAGRGNYFVVQPMYELVTKQGVTMTSCLLLASRHDVSLPLDEDLASVEHLRKLAHSLERHDAAESQPEQDGENILLWQNRDKRAWNETFYLVSSRTTNQEMAVIRRLLNGSETRFAIVPSNDFGKKSGIPYPFPRTAAADQA